MAWALFAGSAGVSPAGGLENWPAGRQRSQAGDAEKRSAKVREFLDFLASQPGVTGFGATVAAKFSATTICVRRLNPSTKADYIVPGDAIRPRQIQGLLTRPGDPVQTVQLAEVLAGEKKPDQNQS